MPSFSVAGEAFSVGLLGRETPPGRTPEVVPHGPSLYLIPTPPALPLASLWNLASGQLAARAPLCRREASPSPVPTS